MLYALIDLFCGAVVPLIAVLIICRFYKDRSAKKTLLLLLFTLYLAEMSDVVGIQSIMYCKWNPVISYIPFENFGEDGFLFQTIANAVMFMPFGFLLPVIWKSFRKLWKTAAAGLLTSVCIEAIQLFSFRATDIDDLLMNTLGTVAGYLVIALFAGKRWKKDGADAAESAGRDAAQLMIVIGVVFFSAMFIKPFLGEAVYGAITQR